MWRATCSAITLCSTTCRAATPPSTCGGDSRRLRCRCVHLHIYFPRFGWDPRTRAEQLFARLKATFGLHSHLIRLNSSSTPSAPGFFPAGPLSRTVPTPPCYLTANDLAGLGNFVRDFVVQSLLPHLSRLVAQLNEQWGASRRGLTGRLFSAGKKYFGSSSPIVSTASASSLPAVPTGPPRPAGAVIGSLYGNPSAASSSSSIASTATSNSTIVAPPTPIVYGVRVQN